MFKPFNNKFKEYLLKLLNNIFVSIKNKTSSLKNEEEQVIYIK